MKYLGIDYGWLIEEFAIFPCLTITLMTLNDARYYDIQFAWFKWYFTIGQIKKKLKEGGYCN